MAEIARASAAAIGISAPGRAIEVKIDGALPPLRCDAALLGQVFSNLMENALKFSPPETSVLVTAAALPDAVQVNGR